jgi:hypothetical protein
MMNQKMMIMMKERGAPRGVLVQTRWWFWRLKRVLSLSLVHLIRIDHTLDSLGLMTSSVQWEARATTPSKQESKLARRFDDGELEGTTDRVAAEMKAEGSILTCEARCLTTAWTRTVPLMLDAEGRWRVSECRRGWWFLLTSTNQGQIIYDSAKCMVPT